MTDTEYNRGLDSLQDDWPSNEFEGEATEFEGEDTPPDGYQYDPDRRLRRIPTPEQKAAARERADKLFDLADLTDQEISRAVHKGIRSGAFVRDDIEFACRRLPRADYIRLFELIATGDATTEERAQRHASETIDDKAYAEIPAPTAFNTDKAAGEAARLYLRDACLGADNFIRPDDRKTVERHIGELHRLGVSDEWAAAAMTAMCFTWEEDPRAMIRRTVRTTFSHYDQLGTPRTARPNRLKAVSWDELKTEPDPDYLWDEYLTTDCIAMIYAEKKIGKTFAALNLGLCIVNELPFCGRATQYGHVMYVYGEGSKPLVKLRIMAWLKATVAAKYPGRDGMTKAERKQLKHDREAYRAILERNIATSFHLVPTRVAVNDPAEVLTLIQQNPDIRVHGQPWKGLIIVDTLLRCLKGNVNEQSDMSAFIEGCDNLRDETGCAVLFMHHVGKDKSRGAMGSIVALTNPDFAATIVKGRTKGERVFRITDSRYGAADEAEEFVFTLPTVQLGDDANGRPLVSCYVEYQRHQQRGEDSPSLDESPTDDRVFAILEAIDREENPTVKSLRESFKLARTTMDKTLKDARAAGYLTDKGLTLTKKGRAFLENTNSEEDDE